ncbi:MAG: helix-hairpin-helix domain-containing protein [Williamsia sp.]|nr:helix-hairpin-helix domain-containing protein [Williamsia sp.]
MSKICVMLMCLLSCILLCKSLRAQSDLVSLTTQQQWEALSEKGITLPDDDQFLQKLNYFSRHPLNLNKAGKEDLEELGLINEIQVNQLLTYRRMLGNLLSVYELQAVPGWDLSLIQRVLPYITLMNAATAWNKVKGRWNKGESSLLLRYSTQLEKEAGYQADTNGKRNYLGSPARLFMRYQYKSKDILQLNFLGEKDAGEQFFRGYQKKGFDFYSFYVAIGKLGIIKQLIVGDYTVSMGQGLIQWQGLSIARGPGVIALERQSSVLHPYSSPGEVQFHRGAAISLQKRAWELTGFVSFKKLSAHTEPDTGSRQESIRSLLSSGYHRTVGELRTKNNIRQLAGGGALIYTTPAVHVALQAVSYRFSEPFQKQDQPYNLFAIRGRSFLNVSASYNYTRRNLHLFGETAVDKDFHSASINGMLLSLHPRVDLAVVHRMLARDYHSINADANTQNTQPANEQGLYTGMVLRPADGWEIEVASDAYRFPWLKYRIDAPAAGKEFLVQSSYKPSKQVEVTSRFRWQSKPLSATGSDGVMSVVKAVQQTNWRLQIDLSPSKKLTLQNRCEMVWYNKKAADREEGFLIFSEIYYRPAHFPVSGNARVQYTETDGYNSRLYAFESSVRYAFSVPAFFEKSFRYYCNLRVNVSSLLHRKSGIRIDGWLRWAQSIYPEKNSLGEGNDLIPGNRKSELTLELILGP